MKPAYRIVSVIVLLLVSGALWGQSGLYTVTGNKVNIRSGPGTGYPVVGSRKKGDTVTVWAMHDASWAEIQSGTSSAYMSRRYLAYQGPVPQTEATPVLSGITKDKSSRKGLWDSLFEIVKAILWICAIAIVIGGWLELDIGGAAFLLQIICGIGFVIGGWIFQNAKAGAVIGMGAGLLLGARHLLSALDWDLSGLGWVTCLLWYLISLPFYLLNLLQFWLSKPWRPFMKKNVLSDKSKPGMRTFLRILQVPFYLALFPLRFVNAFYYNMLIHNLYEFSNYLLEVATPSDVEEGKGDFGKWILFLPVRIIKYPLYHGFLTFVESIVWTIMDTIFPAVTLYHGTRQCYADNMLCDPRRNGDRRCRSGWLSGIWNVGGGNYAGDGIYFGIFRKTLRNYQNGAAIVTRVTLGKTIDCVLMPDYVYNQAGHPNAKAVSNWGLDHGYVAGEWWRSDRNTRWWEICLFDRQNKYNEMWRIRPIYAINSNTGIMQRVPGGTAHWLFRKMIINDIKYTFHRLFRK